jgi:hypothetical protein
MTTLLRLGFGLVLLGMTLGLALSFLAGPMGVLKRTGALKAARWLARAICRTIVLMFRLVTKTRRLHIRRPGARQMTRRAG